MNKCPDCGSPQLCKELYDGSVSYQFDCGSVARAEIGVVWPSVSCLLRQLAQRTQERDDAMERLYFERKMVDNEARKLVAAEAKLERIRVAAGKWRCDDADDEMILCRCFDAEFGKDGW